jgi:DNA-binding NarL/FixJ family response regulator
MSDREPIRVAIVDDHPTLREGTAGLIDREPDLQVVGLAGSLDEAAELLRDPHPPDVLVLDIRLGSERGLDILAELAASGRNRPAVVVWTAYDLPQYVAYAMRAGAAGFVLKTASTRELLEAIRRAARGGAQFTRRPARDTVILGGRDRELVASLVEGRSNDEIAAAWGVGTRAVEAHLTRLYERFGAQSRAELAVRAVREGWLEIPVSGAIEGPMKRA